MIIINAHILSMCNQDIENGYIIVENGIITDVGDMKNSKCADEIFDAGGGFAVPGFIDAHTHMGLEIKKKFTNPNNCSYRAIDDVDFNDRYFKRAADNGIIAAAISPVSICPVGGVVSVVNTHTKAIIKKEAALKLSMGENPIKAFGLTKTKINSYVLQACEESHLPIHIHVHDKESINLLKSKNVILVHGTESDGNFDIMAGPMLTDISKNELEMLSYEKLCSQYKNGAKIAITSDHPETPSDYLLLYAQIAAKHGVEFNDALKMITVNPAEMLRIDNQYGKIKKGCKSGIVIFDRHPIDFYSKIKKVIF